MNLTRSRRRRVSLGERACNYGNCSGEGKKKSRLRRPECRESESLTDFLFFRVIIRENLRKLFRAILGWKIKRVLLSGAVLEYYYYFF